VSRAGFWERVLHSWRIEGCEVAPNDIDVVVLYVQIRVVGLTKVNVHIRVAGVAQR